MSSYLEKHKILHGGICLSWLAVTFCKKYVLDCVYSPFTKITYILTFPPVSLEQFFRSIWNAVSWAVVLIFPRIKLNSQLSCCGFFSVNTRHFSKSQCWSCCLPTGEPTMAPLHLHLQNKAQPLHCHPRPFTIWPNLHLFSPVLQSLLSAALYSCVQFHHSAPFLWNRDLDFTTC